MYRIYTCIECIEYMHLKLNVFYFRSVLFKIVNRTLTMNENVNVESFMVSTTLLLLTTMSA